VCCCDACSGFVWVTHTHSAGGERQANRVELRAAPLAQNWPVCQLKQCVRKGCCVCCFDACSGFVWVTHTHSAGGERQANWVELRAAPLAQNWPVCQWKQCTQTHLHVPRLDQNRLKTPYMTVYLVNSLPKTPYIHRIHMVLNNPTHAALVSHPQAKPSMCVCVCVCAYLILCVHALICFTLFCVCILFYVFMCSCVSLCYG